MSSELTGEAAKERAAKRLRSKTERAIANDDELKENPPLFDSMTIEQRIHFMETTATEQQKMREQYGDAIDAQPGVRSPLTPEHRAALTALLEDESGLEQRAAAETAAVTLEEEVLSAEMLRRGGRRNAAAASATLFEHELNKANVALRRKARGPATLFDPSLSMAEEVEEARYTAAREQRAFREAYYRSGQVGSSAFDPADPEQQQMNSTFDRKEEDKLFWEGMQFEDGEEFEAFYDSDEQHPRPAHGMPLRKLAPATVRAMARGEFLGDSDDMEEVQRELLRGVDRRGVADQALSPAEQELDRERRQLARTVLKPISIPNRPLQQVFELVLDVSQSSNTVTGGRENAYRALVVAGNGHGGVGYGVGKHKEMEVAVERASAAAERDMIFISTHRGQLYHDLVGRKNGVTVVLQSRGPGFDRPAGSHEISAVCELAGLRGVAGFTTGAKRRTPYTVIQALFNAFSAHVPPEYVAHERGQRLIYQTADRHAPMNVSPQAVRGRHPLGVMAR